MKDIRFWKERKNNSKDFGGHYDYSNPNNYWGSVLIQNNK